jgi:peptide/nickel transport system permease protein
MSDITTAAVTQGAVADLPPGEGRTAARLRAMLRNPSALAGGVITLVLVLLALASTFGLLPHDPVAQDAPSRFARPGAEFWFGTDQFGRDIFSRVAAGVASSGLIALTAVAFAAVVGTLAGVVAGFYRGTSDTLISGVTNVLFAFPPLLLALSLASVLTRTWFTIAVAIAIVYVPIFIRVARGPVLSLREIEYVRAATSSGQPRWTVMLRHVLPNITSIVIVQVTLALSWAVLTEASLSFLGLGAPPPAPSLGSMIYESKTLVTIAPWTMVAPGVVIVLFVVGLNLLGDGLRDVLDPRSKEWR